MWDLIVVGGRYAGLSAAAQAARNGLKVLVLDRDKKPGVPVRTTGVLIRPAFMDMNLPIDIIRKRMRGGILHSPNGKSLELDFGQDTFYLPDNVGLMQHLTDFAVDEGARIKFGSNVTGVTVGDVSKVKVGTNIFKSRFLIGADGYGSVVARDAGLHSDCKYFIGYEEHVSGVDNREFGPMTHAYLDFSIAPGYGYWYIPMGEHGGLVGIAYYEEFNREMGALERITLVKKKLFPQKALKRLDVHAGMVPVSKPLGKNYAKGVFVVGDAARQVGALGADGIWFSFNSGKIAGDVVADIIDGKDGYSLYDFQWARYQRILESEFKARKLVDSIKDNSFYDKLLASITSEEALEFCRDIEASHLSRSFMHLLFKPMLLELLAEAGIGSMKR